MIVLQFKQHGFTLVEMMITVAIVGILSAIAVPQYQHYVSKAQANRVIHETGELRLIIEDCLQSGQINFGTGNNDCEIGMSMSNLMHLGLPQISNPLTVNTTITATMSNQTTSILRQKKIIWQRTASGSWHCKSNVESKYLPSYCQYDATIS